MRASHALACALLLVACDGGEGQSCLLDSDCVSFADVCIDGTCQPVGAVPEGGLPDSGPPMTDAGPGMDAGPPTDAGPGDAGPASDAGPPIEAGPMLCTDVSGTWGITGIVTACGSAMVGETVAVANDPAGSCTFTAIPAGDAALSIVGSFMLDDMGALSGTIDAGAAGDMICTGNVMGGNAMTLVCGGCVMNLSLM